MKPLALSTLLAILPLAAGILPVDLPAPDATPPSKDKPVKVYILSGQSNMLGFGKVEGAPPLYSSVFLSPDPSVKPCKMPVDNAALMPLDIFVSETGDEKGATALFFGGAAKEGTRGTTPSGVQPSKVVKFALGTVSEQVPAIDGHPAQVVNAWLEVPRDGTYEVHAGMEGSSHATVTLHRQKVYNKLPKAAEATITRIQLKQGKRYPLHINFYGTGSAAFWMEQVELQGMGDLRWTVETLGRFPAMLDAKGEWTVRNDVMLNDAYMGKGKSDPLSAPACGPTFGPELGFGYVMGTYHDEPVIVMKADIGNRSLGWDILPPGTKSYTHEGKNYPGYGQTLDADGNIVKPAEGGWYAGKQYDDYTAAIRNVLDNFDERYPEYAAQGFEVAGFAWWQGHKDGGNPGHIAHYEQNLVNLIKAWRKEFDAPKAKWAIATVGFSGKDMPENYLQVAAAQMAVADPERHPELAGTVKTIDTRPFWRGPEVSPKNQSYHYNHNAETYMLTGDALGRAMVELHGGKVVYPSGGMDPSLNPIPHMQPPSREETAAMADALRPIMLGKIIPGYLAQADGIPAYRRHGMLLSDLVANKAPEKPVKSLRSQLDKLVGYYQLAGIDSYGWKKFGPEMQTAEWQYFSFDPREKAPKDDKGRVGDMYREVTFPDGMENWFAADFDPAKAGWKTGAAPFGQKNGEQVALIPGCKVPHCGCHIAPATKWAHEVLLMRQTFEVPKFKDGHRYRLIVGGAGHGWSGEGFALYVDGQQVAEMTGGYYKSGGDARGAYIFEDLMPAFADGKITIAAKAFLRQTGHRGKPAAPSGHLSIWIEEARLPEARLPEAVLPPSAKEPE